MKNFPPILIQDRARWTYSVPRPIGVVISCDDGGITKPRKELQGVGVSQMAAGCQVTAPELFLPTASSSKEAGDVKIIPKHNWKLCHLLKTLWCSRNSSKKGHSRSGRWKEPVSGNGPG